MTDGARNVLVASTNADACEVMARVMETAGYEAVRLPADAVIADAVATIRPDGLLLDLGSANLPALRALRELDDAVGTGVRVVMFGTGPAGGRLAWQAGADGYLLRPIHARELTAAFTEVMDLDAAGREARRTAGAQALSA